MTDVEFKNPFFLMKVMKKLLKVFKNFNLVSAGLKTKIERYCIENYVKILDKKKRYN